ncbi:MAG: hypothetical protein LBU86_06290 [Oscillospiraceae bacterium]|jgi:hypothetical protein|nr:hypothetical protein [Oscillospiraceae bacterium]
MKTIFKLLLGLLVLSFILALTFGLSAAAAGVFFSMLGSILGIVGSVIGFCFKAAFFALRLVFNPIVLILILAFVLSGKYKSHSRN